MLAQFGFASTRNHGDFFAWHLSAMFSMCLELGDAAMNIYPDKADRLPPHSDEAERGALGCILLASDDAKRMASKVRNADFYDHRHKEIFAAIFCLIVDHSPVDVLTVVQWLKDKGRLIG